MKFSSKSVFTELPSTGTWISFTNRNSLMDSRIFGKSASGQTPESGTQEAWAGPRRACPMDSLGA
jgi:hypothetical protein